MTPARSLLEAAGDRSAKIAANRRMLDRFERIAERLAAAGEPEDAISAVAVGAHVVSMNHPGVLSSARLEQVLAGIAAERLAPSPSRERRGSPKRVLHVATETYGVGGHTRVLWRWIARDGDRNHDLVLTGQRAGVPEGLLSAVTAAGGRAIALGADDPWLTRARALRELARDADVVVLYNHYRDPIPVLAFSDAGDRTPVITFNHADHMLWLGYSVTDVLNCCRPSPANAMRGLPEKRIHVAPFPVTGPDGQTPAEPLSERDRAEARASVLGQLGWPADTVVVLTVGHEHKYSGPRGATLLDMIGAMLADTPSARLLAVGARDAGAFRELRERTGGRVAAIGPVGGISRIFSAADVYLESWPFGGQSASAEAAAHGLPVLAYAPSDVEGAVLSTHPMYGANLARTPDEYRRVFHELLTDDARRADLAERSRAAVVTSDAGWRDGVEEAYRMAVELGPVRASELLPPAEGDGDLHVVTDVIQDSIAAHHPGLDPERAATAFELIERNADVRGIFRTLAGRFSVPEIDRRFETAFAAPPASPGALRAVVDEFRRLALIGAAERYVIALHPGDAETAVPVLESALADGPDVDVDLVLGDDPSALRPECSLEVATPVSEPGQPASAAADLAA